MWRSQKGRAASAGERSQLAAEVWHWKPHSAQRRFFCCPAQVKSAACGRRWGKTEALSVDVASLALTEARAGRACRQLVVAPTDTQARLLGNEIVRRLQAAFDLGGEWTRGLALKIQRSPALQVTIAEEGKGAEARATVFCRTAGRDGSSLRGLWAHRIVVDEASRVPDTVLTEVLLPMLMDVGGEYVLASSPFGRRSAFYRLFAKGMAETSPPGPLSSREGESEGEGVTFASFQCPTSDNPHNDASFLDAMREEFGDAMYAQEILAEFTDDFGAVFREDDIAGCLAANSRVAAKGGALLSEPQPGRIYSAGIDWGRKQDYTVVAVLDATERPARLVHLQRWTATGWEKQLADVADTLAKFGPLRVLADGNSIGDPLAETLMAAIRAAQARLQLPDPRGVTVERFVFTADTKLQVVDNLNLGLSRRGLTYPHHQALLSELRGFEYGAVGSSGRARMAAKGSGHDDIVMALALAFYCAPEGPPESPSSLVLLGSSLRR